tara:strand:- start:228 stop:551 length:324 start_codon:yes stop_codon:yes gene_type:complete
MAKEIDNFKNWIQFHNNNPHIYPEFEKRIMNYSRYVDRGLNARFVFEQMRLDYRIKTRDSNGEKLEPYKLPNAMIAYYSRYFIHNHPAKENLFVHKTLKYEPDFTVM